MSDIVINSWLTTNRCPKIMWKNLKEYILQAYGKKKRIASVFTSRWLSKILQRESKLYAQHQDYDHAVWGLLTSFTYFCKGERNTKVQTALTSATPPGSYFRLSRPGPVWLNWERVRTSLLMVDKTKMNVQNHQSELLKKFYEFLTQPASLTAHGGTTWRRQLIAPEPSNKSECHA